MADSLLGNINGRYYQQLGVLTGNQNVIKVLVEDELDVPFWNDVLTHTVQNKKFKISPYTYNEPHHKIRKIAFNNTCIL